MSDAEKKERTREYQKKWREENQEKIVQYRKDYRRKNRERLLEYDRERYAAKRAKLKEKHPELIRYTKRETEEIQKLTYAISFLTKIPEEEVTRFAKAEAKRTGTSFVIALNKILTRVQNWDK